VGRPRLHEKASGLLVVSLALWLSACASGPGGPLEPIVVGGERFFSVEWQPDIRDGRPGIAGYVSNDWGLPAARIRLLVDSLDPGGELLGQQLVTVGSLTPGMRGYFEAPVRQPAPAYRVRIFSWDWVLTEISARPRLLR